jgi:hypothetical protein
VEREGRGQRSTADDKRGRRGTCAKRGRTEDGGAGAETGDEEDRFRRMRLPLRKAVGGQAGVFSVSYVHEGINSPGSRSSSGTGAGLRAHKPAAHHN